MKREDAHALLDGARDGDEVTAHQITQALMDTGEIEDDAPIVRIHREAGTWERMSVPALLRPACHWDGIAA